MRANFILICICLLSLLSTGANATTYTKQSYGKNAAGVESFSITFTASDCDFEDMDHDSYYAWKINMADPNLTRLLPAGSILYNATLSYKNIYDWQPESNDNLYTYLLNSVPTYSSSNWLNSTKDILKWHEDSSHQGFSAYSPTGSQWTRVGVWHDEEVKYDSKHKKPGINTDFNSDNRTYNPIKNNFSYNLGVMGLMPTLDNYISDIDKTFYLGFDPDCHYYNDKILLTMYFGPVFSTPEPSTILLVGLGLGGMLVWRRKRR
jgi:hypothetical protein